MQIIISEGLKLKFSQKYLHEKKIIFDIGVTSRPKFILVVKYNLKSFKSIFICAKVTNNAGLLYESPRR